MMVYAKQRHGFTDQRLIAHLYQTMFDFVMRSLEPAATATRSSRE
jgi:hypothetical protein